MSPEGTTEDQGSSAPDRVLHRGSADASSSAGKPAREPATWSGSPAPEGTEALIRSGYSRELATLLALRGAENPEQAEEFLHPSPSQLHSPHLLAGMAEALDRLDQAKELQQKVAVVGDYDVDGVSGTALLVAALRACGVEAEAIVPHRLREGYGFQPEHADRAARQGSSLVVTVDCGTTAVEAIRAAQAHGLDVIVVDHHLPADDFPVSAIQINPRQELCSYPYSDLAAAGLALKLAIALLERSGKKVPLDALLRVACLGTIADVVPLVSENRVIASLGLRALARPRSPGLKALIDVSRIRPPVRAHHVGFRLGPRINAAGRLDSAERALELLMTRDEGRAQELAAELDLWNQRRRGEEQRVVDEAFEIFDSLTSLPNLLVAWSPQWHRGVVGIAAGRLARRFHRPAILLGVEGETATGSGRSIPGIHLHSFLSPFRSDLERFGGHAQAIGLSARTHHLEELRERWLEAADWPEDKLTRRYRYDLALSGARSFGRRLFEELERLEPFGQGNPSPLLRIGPLTRVGEAKEFGVNHLKAVARGDDGGQIRLLGWRWQERAGDLDGRFEVLGHAEWDDYLSAPVLRLVDARPCT